MSFTLHENEFERHRDQIDSLRQRTGGEIVSKASSPKVFLSYGLLYAGIVGWWMGIGQKSTVDVVRESGTALQYTVDTLDQILEVYRNTELVHAEKAKEIEAEVDELDGRFC
ncbi:MAG: hypothetical protein GXX86_09255 [Propionibacterium sp.]|nr:hypothetical protein [Propionibacterium sp.]